MRVPAVIDTPADMSEDEALRRSRPMKLAVVTPVFNESAAVDSYFSAVSQVLFSLPDVETSILLVDDGSNDDSWLQIVALARTQARVSGLRLSRNFGAHYALTAGLDHVPADCDAVALLACDLQDPPETIIEFVEQWRQGADIVWGKRRERSDSRWRVLASQALFGILKRHAMPRGSRFQTGSFLLMDRSVLLSLVSYREHNRAIFALVAWTGYEQAIVTYDRAERKTGRSGWSLNKMLHSAYDVLIGFSGFPARIITYAGFLMAVTSFAALVYIVAVWAVSDVQPGWTGIMATMSAFFGVLFMMLGVMTEYLYRIFLESKNRPLYLVAKRTASLDT